MRPPAKCRTGWLAKRVCSTGVRNMWFRPDRWFNITSIVFFRQYCFNCLPLELVSPLSFSSLSPPFRYIIKSSGGGVNDVMTFFFKTVFSMCRESRGIRALQPRYRQNSIGPLVRSEIVFVREINEARKTIIISYTTPTHGTRWRKKKHH